MSQVLDQFERQQALDIAHSFIVQAPAGSGKTELLTQRFLSLLAAVKHPEEIIALTFTKKAASEMRNRILLALERAAYQAAPTDAHQLTTWQLAHNALQQAEAQGWNLLANPNRLRIQTIDSFCASLVKQMPIMAGFGAQIAIADNAEPLYEQAADQLLSQLESNEPWAEDLENILLHLDNNADRLKELFVSMLAKREQWLPHVLASRNDSDLKARLETTLQTVIQDTLERAADYLPSVLESELLQLISFARENLQQEPWDCLPDPALNELPQWQWLAKSLLTEKDEWRKRFTINEGFPPEKEGSDKEEKAFYKAQKDKMLAVLDELGSYEDFRAALAAVQQVPPAFYSPDQWRTLNSLLKLLPRLAAELQVIFQLQATVDYSEMMSAALTALGDADNPTDLALQLDYRIQHLLVDEFQDTSTRQYHLLEKLTAGWLPDDGRTLFVVGDPMQSIYRFRSAEVGLFLRAQQFGIGTIELIPLTLQVNFRSCAAIVDWINQSFADIFPKQPDIAMGAVSLSPAAAFHGDTEMPAVIAYQHDGENNSEADSITQIIQQSPADAEIAILVQTRSQLSDILPRLQAAHIPYQAVEIESLSGVMLIQDLLTLTAALSHLGDRLAWLSMLRAPWCGLQLTDLQLLAADPDHKTLWDNIQDAQVFARLSRLGQQRLASVRDHLGYLLAQRSRYALADGVRAAWLLLQAPTMARHDTDLANAEVFFTLLQDLEQANQFSMETLRNKLSRLYAAPQQQAARVQVMTIHKAKGLEFDIVILPKLQSRKRGDEPELLRWLEYSNANSSEQLLLAPIKAKAAAEDAIYDFVGGQETIKQRYETARLLYVAATRAKKQLYLLAEYTNDDPKKPFMPIKNTLLRLLWPSSSSLFQPATATSTYLSSATRNNMLYRIEPTNMIPGPGNTPQYHNANRPIVSSRTPRIIGTLMHEVLAILSRAPADECKAILNNIYWQQRLRQLGIADTVSAWAQVQNAITNMLQSNTGRWLLQQPNSQAEFALSAVIDGEVQKLILDLTFVEDNIRWIVDYKASQPVEGQSMTDFLQQEKQQYIKKLNEYAYALQNIDSHAIKIGLYFPFCDQWLQWDAEPKTLVRSEHVICR